MKYFTIGDRVQFPSSIAASGTVIGSIIQAQTIDSVVWLTVQDDTSYPWMVRADICSPHGSAPPANLIRVK